MEQPQARTLGALATAWTGLYRRGAAVAAALALTVAAGCARPITNAGLPIPAAKPGMEQRPFELRPPFELATNEDAIVRIVTDVTCTGTLITEDLVLTAHHCVAARDDNGRTLRRDQDAEAISIELGGDHLPWGDVKVRAVVSPDCGYTSGEGDIAILVLSRRLVGIPTLPPRIEAEPASKEQVTPYGFGRCALSRDPIHLAPRLGGTIDAVSPGHFVAIASICPGDSGGPARSDRGGDVVGVISSSVMDGDERTTGTSYFSRLDVWPELFSAAREIAAGASPSELPPYRGCLR
ncbi:MULTISPECIES: trypsin-like serine peptidase [Sorangium]|uniref:Probable serine protease n=1 Tax=Sorangium cellulosum (strain So ce56) TaxID=448385 RepID=A9FT78_SORC5|nr:trypsin-like serine protease [Sorangium cellulosum]CAN98501.1 probable serine protease [Sorangium cellulosum So ce56]